MADYQSLGSEQLNKGKIFFFLLVLGATIYTAWIFLQKFALLTPTQLTAIFYIALPSLISIVALIVFGFLAWKTERKKLFGILFVAVFLTSVYFLREMIGQFDRLPFPSGIGLSVIYTIMGILSIIPIGYNTFRREIKPPIDTVTVEDKEESPTRFGAKAKLLVGLVFVGFTVFNVAFRQQGFVQAPVFSVTDALLSEALVSGVVGGVLETAFFFSVIIAILHYIIWRVSGSGLLASIFSVAGIFIIFLLFHSTVYDYNQSALISVGIFGFMNGVNTQLFRDNLINMKWHFTNNVLVVLLQIQKIVLTVVR